MVAWVPPRPKATGPGTARRCVAPREAPPHRRPILTTAAGDTVSTSTRGKAMGTLHSASSFHERGAIDDESDVGAGSPNVELERAAVREASEARDQGGSSDTSSRAGERQGRRGTSGPNGRRACHRWTQRRLTSARHYPPDAAPSAGHSARPRDGHRLRTPSSRCARTRESPGARATSIRRPRPDSAP